MKECRYSSSSSSSSCHARVVKLGLDRDPIATTQLIKAYVTHCNHHSPVDLLPCVTRLFDGVPAASRDPVLWTALITAYSRSHLPSTSLLLFSRMLASAARPNHFTLASAARAAAALGDPLLSRTLHGLSSKLGLLPNVVVSTSILHMYSRCSHIASARHLFDQMTRRNTVTWNSMIAGYTTAGMPAHALDLLHRMRCAEVHLDHFSAASGFNACARLGDLRSAMQIHAYLLLAGLQHDDAVVATSLAGMYFRCGEVGCAERAMEGRQESVTSKLTMIKGYAFNEMYNDAVRCISRDSGGFVKMAVMDRSIIVSVLTMCANLGLLRTGRKIHGIIVTIGAFDSLEEDCAVLLNALISMYCKCCSTGDARNVFDGVSERHTPHWNSMIAGYIQNGLLEEAQGCFDVMPTRDVISWTTIITGYVQCGFAQQGLMLLSRLHSDGGSVRGNCYTFATALYACSCLAALDLGKQIHAQVLRTTSDDHVVVVETSLVDMYCKSGGLDYAQRVFERMQVKNVVSWTSMIGGYAAHGFGSEAITVLEKMISVGIRPNEVTLIAVLSACSRSGLVEEGIHYFILMRDEYGIAPGSDHYTCLVDLLGRAGKLVEAWNLVEEIKSRHGNSDKSTTMINDEGSSIQGALLAGCGLHANVEIGNKVGNEMLKKKHQSADAYVSLSNVYAASEMWDKVYDVREEWRKQGAIKKPGHSQICG